MSSFLDLPTSESDLKSTNAGISNVTIRQVASNRNAAGDSFSNGELLFDLNVDANTRFCPHRSYFRVRFNVQGDAGDPVLANDMALGVNPCSALWSQCSARINNTEVSRTSDYVSAIDTLERRLHKGEPWLKTVGNTDYSLEPHQPKRANKLAVDGNENLGVDSTATFPQLVGNAVAGNVTIAYVSATGVCTLAGADAATIAAYIKVGDALVLDATIATALIGEYPVLAVDGVTFTIEAGLTDFAAANANLDTTKIKRTRYPGRSSSQVEAVWTPQCLSLFKVKNALPCGKYQFRFTPSQNTVWQKRILESLFADKDIANYSVSVQSIYFMAYLFTAPRVENLSYYLDLEGTRVISDNIQSASMTQSNLNVSPSNYAVTIGYQDARAGSNTLISASKLKSYNEAIPPAGSMDWTADTTQQLSRFFFSMNGVKQPYIDYDPAKTDVVNHLYQLYMETQLSNGAYTEAGAGESFEDWLDMGLYLHFLTPSDSSNTDTRIQISSEFNGLAAADVTNLTLLLFDHYRSTSSIVIKDGAVVNVSSYDV